MKGFISKDLHPITAILLSLFFMVGGFFVGMFVAFVVINLFLNFGVTEVLRLMQNPGLEPNGKIAINLFQGITHLCAFTLGPLYFLLSSGQSAGTYLSPQKYVPLGLGILSALLILFIMPANSWIINWNANLQFPEALKAFETWAKTKEDTLKVLTQELTVFDNMGQFWLGMFVFGLIPAIGEEIVFRGILQRNLVISLRNAHVAIWLAAFIFGAIHMQFYGFVPRMLLGVILGYLYFWSGNIWVPIAGHFMNNGFIVLTLYLQQQKMINYEVDSTAVMPWTSILFSVVISVLTLLYLQRGFKNSAPAASKITSV
ncbi:CPBP family intramembrane metalloprotease [Adhaeribacter swui]|uniref:CPBP family intramembrane metalloprotease n=1 Tax=Adhaeribacter swui TaxID=2086471 RepID=A0A7G7GE12_9BACT|nr:CPBP family intramembrane glutamic endopeptidase [Adhaeribacter swui]QNF35396.1 CPBP family intramembrane metalloprotease [Adhaeribacter swui]